MAVLLAGLVFAFWIRTDRLSKNWLNEEIEWWYRQNLILYVKKEDADRFRSLAANMPFDIVHPDTFSQNMALFSVENGLLDSVAKFPGLVASAIKHRL